MLFRTIYQRELAQASYLLGCQATGEALVIDPNSDLQPYLDLAAQEGLRITAVTETHIHADYVSGSRKLAALTGATLYLSDEGPAEWKYAYTSEPNVHLLHDGDTFAIGNVQIAVWHVPGHTPEHLAFVVTDGAQADEPMGIVTGDFVFVGDVGRPDLLERAAGIKGTMRVGAEQLFTALQRFKSLPDYLQVWPGHGAGSACGKALGAVPQSTVGYEKRYNWGVRATDQDTFVNAVLDGQPEPPTYFARMKQINRNGPPLEEPAELKLLGTREFTQWQNNDILLIDLRTPAEFAAGHVPGALNVGIQSSFLTWAGWLVSPDRPIAFIGSSAQALHAAKLLHLIGLDTVVGYWQPDILNTAFPFPLSQGLITQILPADASALLETESVTVLDVRFANEFAQGHVKQSQSVPLPDLAEHLPDVPRDQPVLVYCQGGVRSAIAASILAGAGFTRVYDMIGGYARWEHEMVAQLVGSV